MDCHLHSWCSRHDEAKYSQHYEKLRDRIEGSGCNVVLGHNTVPKSYHKSAHKLQMGVNKYYDERSEEVVQFPRSGAFEVYV